MNAIDEVETVRRIVNRHRGQRGALMSMLLDVQKAYGCLPPRVLRKMARATERTLLDILALAETNDSFILSPGIEDKSHVMPQTLAGVRCYHCNRCLLDSEQFLAERPSIRLTMASNTDDGWFRFTARPAVYAVMSEHPLPSTGDVSFHCPHCSAEIVAPSSCEACGSPLVPMLDARGTITTICSSRICRRTPITKHPKRGDLTNV